MDMCADDGMQEQGKAMKRRGILAAAGAVVAGIVAKQTSEPVAADGQAWSLPYSGTASSPFTSFLVEIVDTGFGGCVHASSSGGAGIQGDSQYLYGVYGTSDNGIGVIGDVGVGAAGTSNIGVAGRVGLHGANAQNNTIGVYGQNAATGTGGIGALGQCDVAGGVGVKGVSTNGFPIIGNVTGASNKAAGVLGAGTVGPGVQGQSTHGHGLVGTTDDTSGHAGLIGNATHTGGIGLMGVAPNYGMPSVGHAGEFYGNVKIYGGSLLAPVMQAAVPHAGDNSYRALHAVTSPEGWIEDFGKGTLAADKAEITLDHDFAALIRPDYHVFLTAHGPQNLYVTQQTGSGFTVMAMAWAAAAGGPKRAEGTGTFSWRVVGKRQDVSGERLAKVAAPPAPNRPAAFTIPETPAVTPPAKQP